MCVDTGRRIELHRCEALVPVQEFGQESVPLDIQPRKRSLALRGRLDPSPRYSPFRYPVSILACSRIDLNDVTFIYEQWHLHIEPAFNGCGLQNVCSCVASRARLSPNDLTFDEIWERSSNWVAIMEEPFQKAYDQFRPKKAECVIRS